MKNYQDLQHLYRLVEIKKSCVDIDFAYAFICAMANSELELQQWMPMLFLSEDHHFSGEGVASDFAQVVLVIYQQALASFQDNNPAMLTLEGGRFKTNEAVVNFANGYLQGLMLIDSLQLTLFAENSPTADLQQTCLLLLDKLATPETDDIQKITLFEQLPSRDEIIKVMPKLLTHYGHQCLSVSH